MAKGRDSSENLDQIALVLRSIKNPSERAELLLDPQGFGARKGVRLDPGFSDALLAEAANINRRLLQVQDDLGVTFPRINDPRQFSELDAESFNSKIGEVAILPAVAAAAAVVEAAALVVIAVTEVYQATKFVKSSAMSSMR